MKVEELQIGDLVQCGNRVEKCLNWLIRIRNHRNPYKISTEFVGGFFHRKEEDVAPIPLTVEILEKNGFVCMQYWHEYQAVGISIQTQLPSVRGQVNGIQFEFGSIRYVHELQHALRLVGLSELAKNLKV